MRIGTPMSGYKTYLTVDIIVEDMTKELATTLTAALAQLIDANRKEGTMCMSSYECELTERCFMRGDFDQIEIYLKKRLGKNSK